MDGLLQVVDPQAARAEEKRKDDTRIEMIIVDFIVI